jgi:hypothetical protein
MATTTTNFGWDIPQSTDLVKDGATAIAALGQDIDTAMVDLKGGTTGQVLAKASGTDLDFSWVAQDDSNAIQNAIVDAKGDLIAATAADTPARLAIGTNGQILTADSTAATGIKWATPATTTSGLTLIAKTTFTSAASQSFNNVFSATYDNYLVKIVLDASSTSGGNTSMRLRASGTDLTSATYARQQINASNTTVSAVRGTGETSFVDNGYIDSAAGSYASFDMTFYAPFLTKVTRITHIAGHDFTGSAQSSWRSVTYGNSSTSSYDGFTIIAGAGSLNGTAYIYGMANA